MNHADPLTAGLAAMSAEAPGTLLDRIVARWVRVPGPIGDVCVAFTDHGIAYVRPSVDDAVFGTSFRRRFGRPLLPAERPPAGLVPALRTGRVAGLRYDLRGLSPFETDVLHAAMTIPRGEMRPYAWIAREIGRPKAVRAVGTALGGNPVPLLIPCHRVIRSDGVVGGYVFGASVKEELLRGEHVNLDEVRALAKRDVHVVGSDTTGIVCLPTCRDARRISPAHRQGFRGPAQAVAAGYRPCRRCRPGAEGAWSP